MRTRNVILALIATSAIYSTHAQQDVQSSKKERTAPSKGAVAATSAEVDAAKTPQPDIYFKERSYDFGAVGQNEEVAHKYQFENRGKATLRIKGVKAACGCAAVLLSSKEIAPGKTGVIEVRLRTKKLRGKIVKGMSVHSNDPDEPKINLEIKGKVKLGIAIEPESLFFMGIAKGETAQRRFKVIQVEKEELVVTNVEANPDYFTTEFRRLEDQKSKGFEVIVTLKPSAPVGVWSEVVTVHTNLRTRPRVDVPVVGRIEGVVTVTPSVCNLGIVKKGNAAQREVIVSTTGDEPLRILEVESDSPALSVETNPIEEGKKHEVIIKLAAGAPAGRLRGVVSIRTNIRGESLIEVPVYGLIKK